MQILQSLRFSGKEDCYKLLVAIQNFPSQIQGVHQDNHIFDRVGLLTARQALLIQCCGAAHDSLIDVQWEGLPYPFLVMWQLIALKSLLDVYVWLNDRFLFLVLLSFQFLSSASTIIFLKFLLKLMEAQPFCNSAKVYLTAILPIITSQLVLRFSDHMVFKMFTAGSALRSDEAAQGFIQS